MRNCRPETCSTVAPLTEFSGALDVPEVLNHYDAAGLEDARNLRNRARPAGFSLDIVNRQARQHHID